MQGSIWGPVTGLAFGQDWAMAMFGAQGVARRMGELGSFAAGMGRQREKPYIGSEQAGEETEHHRTGRHAAQARGRVPTQIKSKAERRLMLLMYDACHIGCLV